MPKQSNQKLKLLYLTKILLEKTDDKHGLSCSQIISELSKYGITAERKAIYSDMEALRAFGIDIVDVHQGKSVLYSVGARDFELPELKLLVDLVQSSKFITNKKSKALIGKIERLTSEHEAKYLDRQVYVAERVKADNERIYYNVDTLHTAIGKDLKVSFQYFQWTVDKEKELRHDGKIYHVNPWILSWYNENYYLIGYNDEVKAIRHYRVDKILKLELTEEPREGKQRFQTLDMAVYTKKIFGMFDGEEQSVKLRAENGLVSVLIDRFGTDLTIRKVDEEHFETVVDVVVSRQFLGWLFALGTGIRIVEPASLAEEMKRLLKGYMEIYEVSQ